MKTQSLRCAIFILTTVFLSPFSIDGESAAEASAAQDNPATCDDKEGWTTWQTIYNDPNDKGRIDVSYRTGTFVFESGGNQHNFRFCNRFDVAATLEVRVITEKSANGVYLARFTIKPNSKYQDGGQWTISKSVNGLKITELALGGVKILIPRPAQTSDCPSGKICVPIEVTFPGKKKAGASGA